MFELLSRLRRDQRGNFAITSALCMVPVIGLTGLGIDFSQAYSARTTIQNEADAIAIAIGALGPKTTQTGLAQTMIDEAVERSQLGTATFRGAWTSETDYQVTATASVPRTLSSLIPVGEADMAVSTVAVARYMGVKEVWKQPTTKQLDDSAWDFNRIYAYCYDTKVGQTDRAAARTQRTAIADNGRGSRRGVYTDPMPQCGAGQVLSFELENTPEANEKPSRANDPKKRYYTDTITNDKGVYQHSGTAGKLLETVVCPSISVCKPGSGGIPVGSKRSPKVNTAACAKGNFMYFGWEDRPGGDNDFDDIRIVIECPERITEGSETVRLVR